MAAVALMHDTVFHATKTDESANELTLFSDLLHDLRQPLSAIEAIAYYLELTIPAEHSEPRKMLLKLQEIVQDAGSMLDRAESRGLLAQ